MTKLKLSESEYRKLIPIAWRLGQGVHRIQLQKGKTILAVKLVAKSQ